MDLILRTLGWPHRVRGEWSFMRKGFYFQLVNLGKILPILQPQFIVGETEMMTLTSVSSFESCG